MTIEINETELAKTILTTARIAHKGERINNQLSGKCRMLEFLGIDYDFLYDDSATRIVGMTINGTQYNI